MDASKGSLSPLHDAADDPQEGGRAPGQRDAQRSPAAMARAFLVCHPVAVVLVNGKVTIGDDVPADVAAAASWTAVLARNPAGCSNWRFPGGTAGALVGDGTSDLLVLPGGAENATSSLQSALADPEIARQLRQRLARLGALHTNLQAAAAPGVNGDDIPATPAATAAPATPATAAFIPHAETPAERPATGSAGGGSSLPMLMQGIGQLPQRLRRLARLARKRLMRARAKTTPARIKALERDVKTLLLLEPRTRSVEGLLDLERSRIDWTLGCIEGITEQTDTYLACRETSDYQAAFASPTPLVSVCIATMDRGDLLVGRALASLRQQTYRNLQIIVVGDHCTDDTGQRIAALNDDRIRFVNLPERGPYPHPGKDRWFVAGSNAMNHALSLCEGQFVTHLDDDDAMVPHRIETLVAAALQDRADFLWHPFWYEQCDGTWRRIGDGRLQLGEVSTGSIFYHRYFTRIRWDVHAYRLQEPGDWNRIRKIKLLRPRCRFVAEPLLYHHQEQQAHAAFVARDGERFLN